MNTFFMMRHAQSDHNVGGWISADKMTDMRSKLTLEGVAQADKLGQQLQKMNIGVIYRSPFNRVKNTCDIVNGYVKASVYVDERLAQYNCGIFNGKLWQERDAFYKNDLEKITKRPPGGENLIDVKERMVAAWNDMNERHQDKNILIISHGNPLRILQWAVLKLSPEALFTDIRVIKWKSNVSPEPEVGKLLMTNE